MAKPTRNLRKIRALLYKDNITQYLTEFQDLNNVVRLSGQAIKKMVTQAIPEKLIELVYSCNKIPPEVTCRVTCGVRIQRLGPDQGLAKGRVNLELHE